VDHNVLALLKAPADLSDRCFEPLRLSLLRNAHIFDGEAQYLYAPEPVLFEELRDSVAVILMVLHERDEDAQRPTLPALPLGRHMVVIKAGARVLVE
jgi:hypothetical protein